MTRIWFHGTDRKSSQLISERGFRPGTYFAEHLEDAIEFGGAYVFEVALDHKPVMDGNWQMRVVEAVPESAIIRLVKYEQSILVDHADRRQEVFEANKPSGPSV